MPFDLNVLGVDGSAREATNRSYLQGLFGSIDFGDFLISCVNLPSKRGGAKLPCRGKLMFSSNSLPQPRFLVRSEGRE